MSQPPAADDPRSPRLRRIERGVEERLARMAEAGELSGLPGEGKPFPPDAYDAAGDRWAAFHLMSNANVIPTWSELRIGIDREHAEIVARARAHLAWAERRRRQLRDLPADLILDEARRSRDRDAQVRREIADAVAQLNAKVQRFNQVAPVDSLQLVPFTAERVFEEAAPPC
ncbi:MAG TPA: DnaJ family domain-containing protein [Candidatus Limnocylindria bacterium]|nr:DnaJ family domain-containing protein [Candidatus Limnocylindria bacterium]